MIRTDATNERTKREYFHFLREALGRDEATIDRVAKSLARFDEATGACIAALASFRLGRVDLAGGFVEQDARSVRTKAAKTFRTFFMPVDNNALDIVAAWVEELPREHLWGPHDPLFPATEMGLAENGGFAPMGLSRRFWASSEPMRAIFRNAFATAKLPYFNPHSFRTMLVRHAMTLDLSPEAMKARSQNLGHSDVPTTFTSYGSVPVHRQGELLRAIADWPSQAGRASLEQVAALEAILANMKAGRS
jgi:integrase/recombinase XerC